MLNADDSDHDCGIFFMYIFLIHFVVLAETCVKHHDIECYATKIGKYVQLNLYRFQTLGVYPG